MARPAINLRALVSMRFLTWLAIAMVAMPVSSAGAMAGFDNQDMAQMEMPMSCDHDDRVGTVTSRPGQVDGQYGQPCCADCDMPDCTTSSTGPVPTLLTDTALEAIRRGSRPHALPGDLTQNSTNQDTPRKPPRV